MDSRIVCTPKRLPPDLWEKAADTATTINPVNRAPVHRLIRVVPGFSPTKAALAVLTTKYWGAKGVKLTVGFLDSPASDLQKHILAHMNAWAAYANVQFVASKTDPQVRIARVPNDGYWSYLGTDILHIKPAEQTMNLEGFTMQTPEPEYKRVVRHETGHTLGFPHEHMRAELVAKIDPDKAIAYFGRTQGWSEAEVRAQVLTPLENGSLLGTATADDHSIMCYQIPGEITKNGEPIVGGTDIDQWDRKFVALIYPKTKTKPTPKVKAKSKAKAKDRKPSRKGKPRAKSTGGRTRRG